MRLTLRYVHGIDYNCVCPAAVGGADCRRPEVCLSVRVDTLTCIESLCALMYAKGDLAAAESLLREVLEVQRETLGSGHPDTLCSIGDLSMLLIRRKLKSTYNYMPACAALHSSLGGLMPLSCAWGPAAASQLSDPLIAR